LLGPHDVNSMIRIRGRAARIGNDFFILIIFNG
jgi:hypothetical protein